MAKKSSRASRISNGGREKANKAHEAKRQAKFAAKRENGTAYKWEPNPYKEGTPEYYDEKLARAVKNQSTKTEYQQSVSRMRKLQNELDKKALEEKDRKGKKSA